MRSDRVVRVLFVLCSASWLLGCSGNATKPCDETVPDGVPFSCPDKTKEPGTLQGECLDGGECGEGLICFAGACISCGGPGETCCQPGGFYTCDDEPTVTCDNTLEVEWPICKSATPPTPPGDPSCSSGSTAHTVYLVDGFCNAQAFIFWTDTAAQAEACAQDLVVKANADPAIMQPVEAGPVDTAPTESKVCKDVNDTFGTHYMNHFGQQQLDACQDNWCADCAWVDGACPG